MIMVSRHGWKLLAELSHCSIFRPEQNLKLWLLSCLLNLKTDRCSKTQMIPDLDWQHSILRYLRIWRIHRRKRFRFQDHTKHVHLLGGRNYLGFTLDWLFVHSHFLDIVHCYIIVLLWLKLCLGSNWVIQADIMNWLELCHDIISSMYLVLISVYFDWNSEHSNLIYFLHKDHKRFWTCSHNL